MNYVVNSSEIKQKRIEWEQGLCKINYLNKDIIRNNKITDAKYVI